MILQEAAAAIADYAPNSRGHDKKRPRFILSTNPHETGSERDDLGHKPRSHVHYKMSDKIRALCNSPERFPELGFIPTEKPIKKHNHQFIKVRRSDAREAIVAVAQYFMAFIDPITCKIGVRAGRQDGKFLTFERKDVLKKTGLTYDAFNEAVRVMEYHDMVERQRIWEEKDDGTYGGRPSIYTVKDEFFKQFGIVEEFKSWAEFVYNKAKKAAGGKLNELAAGLANRFTGKDKPTKKAVKTTSEPEEGTLAYYQNKLPRSKHGEFQFSAAMLRNDNPDMPAPEVFRAAYNAAYNA